MAIDLSCRVEFLFMVESPFSQHKGLRRISSFGPVLMLVGTPFPGTFVGIDGKDAACIEANGLWLWAYAYHLKIIIIIMKVPSHLYLTWGDPVII